MLTVAIFFAEVTAADLEERRAGRAGADLTLAADLARLGVLGTGASCWGSFSLLGLPDSSALDTSNDLGIVFVASIAWSDWAMSSSVSSKDAGGASSRTRVVASSPPTEGRGLVFTSRCSPLSCFCVR